MKNEIEFHEAKVKKAKDKKKAIEEKYELREI